MLFTPITLLATLLSSYVSPTFAKYTRKPRCEDHFSWMTEPMPLPADCFAALDLMPDGTIQFNGTRPNHGEQMNFLLPDKARKYMTSPAAFRHGTCVIHVTRPIRDKHYLPPQPGQRRPRISLPASAMYYTIWPKLREGARSIIRECFLGTAREKIGGNLRVHFTVDGNPMHAFVTVWGSSDQM